MPKRLTRDHAMLPNAPGIGRAAVSLASRGLKSCIWKGVVEALPAGIPLLPRDRRGHGPFTWEATDLAALTEHHRGAGAVPCGVSVESLIAQELMQRRPDRLPALGAASTGGRSRGMGDIDDLSRLGVPEAGAAAIREIGTGAT